MLFLRYQLIIGLLGLLYFLEDVRAQKQCECIEIVHEWGTNYQAKISAQTDLDLFGIRAYFNFSAALTDMDGVSISGGYVEKVTDTYWGAFVDDYQAKAGDTIEFQFQVHYTDGAYAIVTDAKLDEVDVCDGNGHWTTPVPYTNDCDPTGMKPYDYTQLLCMSFLFYEAQRSGKLPDDQRVFWRGDSALGDGSDVNLDLTGGYYDAGDHVKFGFPMAFTATMLSWGLIDFADGYNTAKQTEYAKVAIKWATDYFLKAYSAHDVLYGQVGEGIPDHAYWGRPEDMTMDRPSMKIDDEKPGSELAGETAAALAAAYMIFKDSDHDYATKMLSTAKELYEFANTKRANYHNSITDAANYYRSWSGYADELAWAALWIARATGDDTYVDKAKAHWKEFQEFFEDQVEQFSWDDKRGGVFALFSLLDSDKKYAEALQAFLDHISKDSPYTPGGLVFLDTWGANRHAANIAYLALWAAKHDMNVDTNRKWAAGQMNCLLGDTGHSFVVGYGVDPPARPHHRSSSCPRMPARCTINWAQKQPGPNPMTLYGALVGGPAQDGSYKDDRMDYTHNEVACDYNAAYTGALAALIEINKVDM